MDAMLKAVKTIEMEGLLWGASKLVPVGRLSLAKATIMTAVSRTFLLGATWINRWGRVVWLRNVLQDPSPL